MVWSFCIPSRLVEPWIRRESIDTIQPGILLNGNLAKAYTQTPSRTLSLPAIAQVCHESREEVLNPDLCTTIRITGLIPIIEYEEDDGEDSASDDPSTSAMASTLLPARFNKATDLVFLGPQSLSALLSPVFGTNADSGLARLAAKDPAIGLLLSREIINAGGHEQLREPTDASYRFIKKPVGQVLYEEFLKPRDSVYLEVCRVKIFLNATDREQARRAGSLNESDGICAIVDLRDSTLLRKYTDFFELSLDRSSTDAASQYEDRRKVKALRYFIDDGMSTMLKEIYCIDLIHSPYYFAQDLLHTILLWEAWGTNHQRDRKPDDPRFQDHEFDHWPDFVEGNGQLDKSHHLAEELDLRLPKFTRVVVFELASEETMEAEGPAEE